MTKKVGTRDPRQEPDGSETGENFRVDRVFAPPRASTAPPVRRPSSPGPGLPPRAAGMPAAGTQPPRDGEPADAELSLRRQLSRLQAQLADAQRALATKDEELAAEVEKRLQATAAYEELKLQLERARAERAALAEHHAVELAQLHSNRRIADQAADAALTATLARQRDAHQQELAELRAAHERALAALRGELADPTRKS